MNILIIGCGRTGESITENLLLLNYVKKIYLFNRTTRSTKELAKKINTDKIEVLEKLNELPKVDYVILTLSGMSNNVRREVISKAQTSYEIRQSELKFNLGAVAHIISSLEKLSDKTKIIVVTNPVDEITNYIQTKLPNKIVIGFGADLDAKRYESLLGRRILCFGAHGKAIPLMNEKTNEAYDKLLRETDSRIISFLKTHGMTHKFAGENFRVFFEKLNSEKEEIVHACYRIDSLLGVKNLSMSLPIRVKEGKILGRVEIKPNKIEAKRFLESSKTLKSSIKQILDAHNKLVKYK